MLESLLAHTPAADHLVAVDLEGTVVASAGGPVGPDAGAAAIALWEVAQRTAAIRSPSPLDHLVARTTIGGVVVIACPGGFLAAVARDDARPDRVAYELRRAATGFSLRRAAGAGAH